MLLLGEHVVFYFLQSAASNSRVVYFTHPVYALYISPFVLCCIAVDALKCSVTFF